MVGLETLEPATRTVTDRTQGLGTVGEVRKFISGGLAAISSEIKILLAKLVQHARPEVLYLVRTQQAGPPNLACANQGCRVLCSVPRLRL